MTSRPLPLAALALLVTASAASAQAPAAPENRAALIYERSNLDRGFSDWTSATLLVGRHWSVRQLVEAEYTETRRFDLRDREWALNGAMPLSDQVTASARVTSSPTHHVLARYSAGATLQWEFSKAWLLHGGFKHTSYDETDVDEGLVMLEHYFGNWSAAAGARRSRAFSEHAGSGEARVAYYYGDRSSVGLFLGAGDEITQTGPDTLVFARVRSAALAGQHAFDARWKLRWGLHYIRQGDFYTRRGLTVGVQAAF
jgi:YaiO family outer membrane protein